RTARTAAEQAQIDALKDARLSSALTKNRCIDIDVGLKIFRDQIVWDPVAKNFMFKRKDGTVCSILDGVAAEIPSYLVEAAAQGGGSGSAGSRSVVTD